MFCLNSAIKNWLSCLARQPGVLNSDLAEFEDHLREEIMALEEAKLSTEESFFIASTRLGQAEDLSAQFLVADPERLRHKHLIWMLSGALALIILGVGTGVIADYSTGILIRIFSNHSPQSLGDLGWFRGLFRLAMLLGGGILIWKNIGNNRLEIRLKNSKSWTLVASSFFISVLLILSSVSPTFMFAYSGLEKAELHHIVNVSTLFQLATSVIFPTLIFFGLWRLVRRVG